MSAIKKWFYVCLLTITVTGCTKAYIKAMDRMLESPETEVKNESQKLFYEGKTQQSVDVLRNKIKVSGVNIERQANLCSMLQQVQDYNDIRECLDKLASLLEDKSAPKSGSIEESVSLKNGTYLQDIVSGYTYIGDYDRAIPLAEKYLESQSPGSQQWVLSSHSLIYAYENVGDQKALNDLVSKADATNIKEREDYILWSLVLTSAYTKFDDQAALKRLIFNLDALNVEQISKNKTAGYGGSARNAQEKAMAKDTQKKRVESERVQLMQSIASTKSYIYRELRDYKNALINQELADRYQAQMDADQKKSEAEYREQYPDLADIQQEKQEEFKRVFKPVPHDIEGKKKKIPLLIELGRMKEAAQLMSDTKGYWSPDERETEQFLNAQFYEFDGRINDAINEYKVIIDKIESKRSSIKRESDKIYFGGGNERYYEAIVRLLIKKGLPESALEYAERGKSRALIDMLSAKNDFGLEQNKSKGVNTKELLNELRQAEAEIKRMESEGKTENLIKSRAVVADVKDKVSRVAPEVYALVSVNYKSSNDIKKLLKPNETLVEYFGEQDAIYAFIVTQDKVRTKVLSVSNVQQEVAAYRKSLQNPNSKDATVKAKVLYKNLIQPLQLPKGNLLTIVPHGSLHYLPFAALSDGKSSLVDKYTLRILPSASVLSLLESRQKTAANNILILGNPDLGDRSYDLPGAQKEAKEISLLKPQSKLLLGSDANKEAIASLGAQFSYIHIASHGTFDSLKPRQSGLLLAVQKGNKDPTSGMLTVDDLYNLKLDADLVTLSACETALGSIKSGDDVIGLSRGLFFAGANSVISTLWQVDDVATEKLMLEFYRQLPLVGKREALRKAQLYVKKNYPHPFYWAAFQLAGQ